MSSQQTITRQFIELLSGDLLRDDEEVRSLSQFFDEYGVKDADGNIKLEETAVKLANILDASLTRQVTKPDGTKGPHDDPMSAETREALVAAVLSADGDGDGLASAAEIAQKLKEFTRDVEFTRKDGSKFNQALDLTTLLLSDSGAGKNDFGVLTDRDIQNMTLGFLPPEFRGFFSGLFGDLEEPDKQEIVEDSLEDAFNLMMKGSMPAFHQFWSDDPINTYEFSDNTNMPYYAWMPPGIDGNLEEFMRGDGYNGGFVTRDGEMTRGEEGARQEILTEDPSGAPVSAGVNTTHVKIHPDVETSFETQNFDTMITQRLVDTGVVKFDPADPTARQRFNDFAADIVLGKAIEVHHAPKVLQDIADSGFLKNLPDEARGYLEQRLVDHEPALHTMSERDALRAFDQIVIEYNDTVPNEGKIHVDYDRVNQGSRVFDEFVPIGQTESGEFSRRMQNFVNEAPGMELGLPENVTMVTSHVVPYTRGTEPEETPATVDYEEVSLGTKFDFESTNEDEGYVYSAAVPLTASDFDILKSDVDVISVEADGNMIKTDGLYSAESIWNELGNDSLTVTGVLDKDGDLSFLRVENAAGEGVYVAPGNDGSVVMGELGNVAGHEALLQPKPPEPAPVPVAPTPAPVTSPAPGSGSD